MDNLDDQLKAVMDELQAQVKQRVEQRTAALNKRVADIKEEAPDGPELALGFDIDISWKDVDLIFHLPSVTMVDQRIVIGLPEVTMHDQDIIFHTPSVRMVTKKIAQYFEIHGFTLVWKDMLMDVPEPFMQEQHIVLGIPEFAIRDQEMFIGVPQITMVENRIVLTLPQFKLRSVSAAVHNMKTEAEAAKSETEAGIRADLKELGTQSQGKVVAAVSQVFNASRTKLMQQREQALIVFDNLASSLAATASDLRARNAQPEVLASIDASLQRATTDRQTTEQQFQTQLSALENQEKQVVEQMLAQLAFTPATPAVGAAQAQVLGQWPLSRKPLGMLAVLDRMPRAEGLPATHLSLAA